METDAEAENGGVDTGREKGDVPVMVRGVGIGLAHMYTTLSKVES